MSATTEYQHVFLIYWYSNGLEHHCKEVSSKRQKI